MSIEITISLNNEQAGFLYKDSNWKIKKYYGEEIKCLDLKFWLYGSDDRMKIVKDLIELGVIEEFHTNERLFVLTVVGKKLYHKLMLSDYNTRSKFIVDGKKIME